MELIISFPLFMFRLWLKKNSKYHQDRNWSNGTQNKIKILVPYGFMEIEIFLDWQLAQHALTGQQQKKRTKFKVSLESKKTIFGLVFDAHTADSSPSIFIHYHCIIIYLTSIKYFRFIIKDRPTKSSKKQYTKKENFFCGYHSFTIPFLMIMIGQWYLLFSYENENAVRRKLRNKLWRKK